ncbi:MAG: MBL fold metallo-hydrolase [Candidatus Sumerlaeia bacterium]
MFLKKFKSEGLAHLSWMIGSGSEAVVIDARRDCDIYVDEAHRQGMRITHIFETHRNEDYITGSNDLKRRTNATIHHGKQMDFAFGEPVEDGDTFEVGKLIFKVLHTPGHTMESISIAVYDPAFSKEDAVGVFTGDALFIGDVGRTDFYPDRKEEVAGMLYDSIHNKILPLGDQTILYPAHGAGSVCGSGMAKREFSTLGYERKNNPRLQMSRDDFIDFKVHENHYQPPYFRQMEKYNKEGAPEYWGMPKPIPMDADSFSDAMEHGMVAIDIRSPEAFAGAYIPGSYAMPVNMIPAFAGWYLGYDQDIGIISSDYDSAQTAVQHLCRLGYDRVHAIFLNGLKSWETSGKRYGVIGALYAGDLQEWMDNDKDFTLLDVRSIDEYESGHLPDAKHVYVGELADKINELNIPKDKTVVTFCGSGRRAIIAASIMKQHGYTDVWDCLGSMSACREVGCKMAEPRSENS